MKKSINQLIWEAKKSGKPVNPWAVCTSSVGRKDKAKYERCVMDVKKKSPIKEDRINEYGGYDDPSMYAKHAGSYMQNLKDGYNAMATVLNHFDKLSGEVLDDTLRKEIESFLKTVHNPLDRLGKSIVATEKRNLGHLRGGRPTPRPEEGE